MPDSVNNLIECFKKLPGIGQKSAERMVFTILSDFDDDDYDSFADSLKNVKENIGYCKICNLITDQDICAICSDDFRNRESLIVVEHSKDVFMLEKMGNFDGYYHVLNGLISPFDDVGPDDINLDGLIDRVEKDGIKEIIFVVKSGIEADTTVLYVKKLLQDTDVIISRIANGVPVGADMEYIDALTLEQALNNRKEVLE